MPKIKLWVHTGFAGANHEDFIEIDDVEWSEMTEDERLKLLDAEAKEYMWNLIDCGAEVVGE